MKKTIIASAIAALLASTAIAQDAQVGVDAGVSVDTPSLDAGANSDTGMGADTNAGAEANAATSANAAANVDGDVADNTYGSVIASIKGSADLDLSSVTDQSQITIVTLSSLQGDAATEAAALDTELSANADAQAGLHSRVEGNSAITAKLEAEGYAVADVVSVKSKADGSLIVYVDDRA
ncbi:hypothetical protein [uncultured Devosia sp.]|uniref:hypothetical protein n=1 Tax=uncultured Devosia sp. TaxID=211434 RepID=UPI002635F3FB|nr:hypothetical protein [uncultured Devosia sp.]